MNPLKRWRWWAILALPILVIAANSIGPAGWREPVVKLLWLSWTALCVALAHSARKALFDYANGRQAWLKALEHPIGAGLAFLGLCVVAAVLVLAFTGFARAQGVPLPAQQLAPLVVQEIEQHWPALPRRSYVGALIEKETCRSITHPQCWSTTARLKTSREEGAGLGQITRTWRADGSPRFDALAETQALAPDALREWSWDNVYTRAELGVRGILVKLRDCHARIEALGVVEPMERLAMCDAAYNGGWGGLAQDRHLCALTAGCDPQRWFGHVEHHSNKSRTPWQGYGASAFDINRAHVRATVLLEPRRWRYAQWLGV
ncbi:hypothetical protein CLU88_4357 [Acidovorax sp. 56]|uniref:hypothetical protein n=1 Tax=Acidovorax sp. 56 TaxID=2035205 RepID=UPI000C16FEC0|nr:hypothetical protein [Acidovorax sp. 56]PIF29428.1 hypothetical protein CLU88_4357 [Acidovorax sp. 56]